jgi:hypothetical protein
MTGIVVPETCWASKKYNKIISGIKLVFILQLSQRCTVQQTSKFCTLHKNRLHRAHMRCILPPTYDHVSASSSLSDNKSTQEYASCRIKTAKQKALNTWRATFWPTDDTSYHRQLLSPVGIMLNENEVVLLKAVPRLRVHGSTSPLPHTPWWIAD